MSLCWRKIPPPLIIAELFSTVISPYIIILLSVANIAPPYLARLFDNLLSPVKIMLEWILVIAPPSRQNLLSTSRVLFDGSVKFSNVE